MSGPRFKPLHQLADGRWCCHTEPMHWCAVCGDGGGVERRHVALDTGLPAGTPDWTPRWELERLEREGA